jgi:hypothetical protein
MSKDISRYLAGQRVVASAANPVYLATRYARRRPLVVYAAALLAVAAGTNLTFNDFTRQQSESALHDRALLDGNLCTLAGALRFDVRPLLPPASSEESPADKLEALAEEIDAHATCAAR